MAKSTIISPEKHTIQSTAAKIQTISTKDMIGGAYQGDDHLMGADPVMLLDQVQEAATQVGIILAHMQLQPSHLRSALVLHVV